MQTRHRFFEDLARTANSAAGLFAGAREEVGALLHQRIERILEGMNLVRREEFEVVRDMAVQAREENAALEARLQALEQRFAPTSGPTPHPAPGDAMAAGEAQPDGEGQGHNGDPAQPTA